MPRVSYHFAGRSSRRRDRRQHQPFLRVELGGLAFDCEDWSMGGLCLRGLPPDLEVGQEVELAFSGVRKGRTRAGRSRARVVRIDAKKSQTAFEFVGLADDAFAALEALITGLDH